MSNKPIPLPEAERLVVASDGATIGFLSDMIQGTMGRSVMPGKVVATARSPAVASSLCEDANTMAALRAAGIDVAALLAKRTR